MSDYTPGSERRIFTGLCTDDECGTSIAIWPRYDRPTDLPDREDWEDVFMGCPVCGAEMGMDWEDPMKSSITTGYTDAELKSDDSDVARADMARQALEAAASENDVERYEGNAMLSEGGFIYASEVTQLDDRFRSLADELNKNAKEIEAAAGENPSEEASAEIHVLRRVASRVLATLEGGQAKGGQ